MSLTASRNPLPTNALWFGADVESVRLVALNVMAAGVKLKKIDHSHGDPTKAGVIQLGSSPGAAGLAPLSIDWVRTAVGFGTAPLITDHPPLVCS